jgi:hypothetical protein
VVYDDRITGAEIAEPFARWPIRSFPNGLAARPASALPFLLALVRVRAFWWS